MCDHVNTEWVAEVDVQGYSRCLTRLICKDCGFELDSRDSSD